MKITKRQLRRIIKEEKVRLLNEAASVVLEPERFRNKGEAEDAAVDMVFDGGTQRL